MRHQRSFRQGAVLAAAFTLTCGGAIAQTKPDAGSLLQQIERDRPLELPKRLEPIKEPLPKELKEVPGLSITVRAFTLAGNTLYATDKLLPLLADFIGKAANYGDLVRATDVIAERYRKDGWVVRVYLPVQDITDGNIKIQIVESVFGGVRLEGNPPSRVAFGRVQRMIQAQQPVGTLLRSDQIDRGILLADDLPGVTVAGALMTGERDGETMLAVQAADEPFAQANITADNTGSRSTGPERLSANLSLFSPFGYGEQAGVNASHTEGSDYVRLSHAIPLGMDGMRLDAHVSSLKYKVLTAEFASQNLRGDSQTAGVELNYPVIRSRLFNAYLRAGYDQKWFRNKDVTGDVTDYRMDVGTLGFYGNLFDAVLGGGSNSFNVFVSSGDPKISTDRNTSLRSEKYSKIRYGASRQQVITPSISFSLGLNGQYSDDILDSSEKLSLGGATAIRAYPSGEASGSIGQIIDAELRWNLPQGFVASVFYDWGRVKNTGATDATSRLILKGGGLSLTWSDPTKGLSVRGIYAHRDGENPNPTASGNDQDGSLKKNRYWITATYTF